MRLPGLYWYCLFLHVLILKKHNNSNLSFWRHISKPTLEGFPCRCVWRWPWLWCLQPEGCSWQWRCRLRCQLFLAAVKDLNNKYCYIHATVIWSYIKYMNLYKGILNLVFFIISIFVDFTLAVCRYAKVYKIILMLVLVLRISLRKL